MVQSAVYGWIAPPSTSLHGPVASRLEAFGALQAQPKRHFVTIKEAGLQLSLGRTTFYRLINEGKRIVRRVDAPYKTAFLQQFRISTRHAVAHPGKARGVSLGRHGGSAGANGFSVGA